MAYPYTTSTNSYTMLPPNFNIATSSVDSIGWQPTATAATPSGTLLGGSAAPAASSMLQYAGPMMGIIGGIGSAYSAFAQARSMEQNLKFQADMAAINARMAEGTAQSILAQGEKAQGQVGLRAGKVTSAQKAGQGARGVAIGEGNAAEEVATTNLMKETDMLTINANAVRQAMAARTQAVNAQNESLMKGTTADGISPFSAAATSLVGSAATVANSWYSNSRMSRLAELLGGV